jgi:hypothetical protein
LLGFPKYTDLFPDPPVMLAYCKTLSYHSVNINIFFIDLCNTFYHTRPILHCAWFINKVEIIYRYIYLLVHWSQVHWFKNYYSIRFCCTPYVKNKCGTPFIHRLLG